jgi:HSP20 family protein
MGLPARYDPFGDMRKLQKEMDDMFAAFFERGRQGRQLIEWGARAPLSDIEDTGDALLVSAELPGMDKEDIKIEVDKDSISISAERKDVKEEKEKDYFYCERSYSGFRRRFVLPVEIDPDKVDAEYKEGILKVTMRKAEAEQDKRKEISVK